MYMCHICGWEEVFGFGATEEEAVKVALKQKKKYDGGYLRPWNRETVGEYYGLTVQQIHEGYAYDSYGITNHRKK